MTRVSVASLLPKRYCLESLKGFDLIAVELKLEFVKTIKADVATRLLMQENGERFSVQIAIEVKQVHLDVLS